jgi:TRAP-type C4-dicarboxylate transport system permease small subunit
VVAFLVVGFGAVLVAGGIALWPVARRQVSDSLELSMVWFYGALPVGGTLMILFSLPQLWRLVAGRR